MSQPSLDDIPRQHSKSDPSPQPAGSLDAGLPRSSMARASVALLATFAVGIAGGYAAALLHFPLPYMTGSLLVTAVLGLANVPVRSLWQARAAGQFVTGAAVGTTFTPAILVTIVMLLPLIILGTILSMVIGGLGALILMRLVRLDAKTALLAAMPGGVIEMANVAARVKADPLPIMVLQTMRVGMTVCAAPFLVTWLAEDGARQAIGQSGTMSWLMIAGLMAASFVGGLALYSFRLPNCWFLGSLLVMAAFGALGLLNGRVPEVLLIVAQVTIGTSIGTQYRHEFLTRLLRLLLASLVTVPFALIALAMVAAVYAAALGYPVATLILALAPAGIAEMALTGKVLGLDAALITGFQIVRIVIVISFASYTCRLFERLVENKAAK
jgi:membrane AbrB-like protein